MYGFEVYVETQEMCEFMGCMWDTEYVCIWGLQVCLFVGHRVVDSEYMWDTRYVWIYGVYVGTGYGAPSRGHVHS